MRVGAHVSIAGGLSQAIDRAVVRGAETIQVFASSPRTWAGPNHSPGEIRRFCQKAAKSKIRPVVIHAKYLVNLASPSRETLEKSKQSLIEDLKFAPEIKALGTIVHVGSHKGKGRKKGIEQIVVAAKDILADTPKEAWLILENTAGSETQSVHKIGHRFEEIGGLIARIGSKRVKVCLDTQHSFASGYNVASSRGLDQALKRFDKVIGLEKLVVVHVNDSRFELGSGKDRHENVGKGKIGESGLKLILHHPRLKHLPFILETPALDKEETARREVAKLRKLVS